MRSQQRSSSCKSIGKNTLNLNTSHPVDRALSDRFRGGYTTINEYTFNLDGMILILKTGSTLDNIKVSQGYFEDWIAEKMHMHPPDYHVHPTGDYNHLPPGKEYSGIINAIRFSQHTWKLQFHPEFDAAITKETIQALKNELISEGFDVPQLVNHLADVDFGERIFKRFKELTLINR